MMPNKNKIIAKNNTETSLNNYNKMHLLQKCLLNSDTDIKDNTGEYNKVMNSLRKPIGLPMG